MPHDLHTGHTHDGHTHDAHTHDAHTHDGHTHDGHTHDGHTHDAGPVAGAPNPPLRGALERSDRFRRDSLLGGIFHWGKVSFRELTSTDAVHITIDGNRISAHVDDVSPVKRGADGRTRYSWPRVVAHNLVGLASDVVRRVHGQHGEQRCNLECEIVWVDEPTADGAQVAELICEEPVCPTSSGEKTALTPAVGMAPLLPRRHC
jgi:hypothetical protein